MVKGMEMTKQELIDRRSLEIFNVTTSLYMLSDYHSKVVLDVTKKLVMANINTLCGLTSSESGQAHDILFEASEDGTIPYWTMHKIDVCCMKLGEIIVEYQMTEKQDRDVWLALYNLLEIDCLLESAKIGSCGNTLSAIDGENEWWT